MKRNIVIPLIYDHHTHPYLYAVLNQCLDIRFMNDVKLILEKLRFLNDSNVNIILGWDNSKINFTNEQLENFPPIIICNSSLHSFLINKKAKEIILKNYGDKFINLLNNYFDEDWCEKNIYDILKFLSSLITITSKELKKYFDEILLKKHGIFNFDDMLLINDSVIKKYMEIGYINKINIWADLSEFNNLNTIYKQYIFGIKLFADGAIGSKTASIDRNYLNSNNNGILVYSDKQLYDLFKQINFLNKRIAIHAIGNKAINQVVNIVKLLKEDNIILKHIQIEHAILIDYNTAKLAKELGIILSMQPNNSFDYLKFSDRLNPSLLQLINPFRMLIDNIGFRPGYDLLFSSDGMPHDVEFNLKSSFFPPLKNQIITLKEFIDGYCINNLKEGTIELEIDYEKKLVKSKIKVK